MSKPYSFNVSIDFGRDGAFSGTDDVTAYVQQVQINGGLTDHLSRIANVGTCSITLKNVGARFSPKNSAGSLFTSGWINLPVRVQVTPAGGSTYTLFYGFTRRWQPSPSVYLGEQTAIIECEDFLSRLQERTVQLPLMQNLRTDQLIRAVLADALDGVAATGRIDFSANPADGDTVTVNGTAYRFKSTPAQANDVQIGADLYATITNLCYAVNGQGAAGTHYYANTTRPDYVSAEPTASTYQLITQARPQRWYRCNESSGTTAYDWGFNDRDATYNGLSLGTGGALSGDPATSAEQDGATDYLDMPVIDLSGRSFAIEFWVRFDTLGADQVLLYNGGAGTRESWELSVNASGGGLIGFYNDSHTIANSTFTTGTWYHVAFNYDRAENAAAFYLNGALVNTRTTGGDLINQALFLGTNDTFDGRIQDIQLYNRLLSEVEIQARYAARATPVGVTIRARLRGTLGNAFTLAEGSSALTVSGATLSGGTDAPAGMLDIQTSTNRASAYAGDTWANTDALTAIEKITGSEPGYFFQQPNGTLTWKNKAWWSGLPGQALTATFGGQLLVNGDLDALYNRIITSVSPRGTLTSGVIAKSDAVLEVKPSDQVVNSGRAGGAGSPGNKLRVNETQSRPDPRITNIKLRYVDPGTGQLIGARSLVLPLVAGTDFDAYDAKEGGRDYTSDPELPDQLTFGVVAASNGMEISAQTTTLGSLYLRNFQVRGEGLVSYDPLEFVAEDAASIALYGQKELKIAFDLDADPRLAEGLGRYLLRRYKTPTWRIMTLDAGDHKEAGGVSLFSLQIGDVVSVSDSMAAPTAVKVAIAGMELTFTQFSVGMVLRVIELDEATHGIWGDPVYGQWGVTMRFGL